jgi:hypothetical protein
MDKVSISPTGLIRNMLLPPDKLSLYLDLFQVCPLNAHTLPLNLALFFLRKYFAAILFKPHLRCFRRAHFQQSL